MNLCQLQQIQLNQLICLKEVENQPLRHAQNMKTSETQGLPFLHLKTTTVNIDTNDGLVNGATGQLMRIDNCMINGSLLVYWTVD